MGSYLARRSSGEHFAGGPLAGAYRSVHVTVPDLRRLGPRPVDFGGLHPRSPDRGSPGDRLSGAAMDGGVAFDQADREKGTDRGGCARLRQ